MKKGFSGFLFYLGWVLVFVVTATCTVLLFRRFSPPDAPWLPFAALGAFEYGVLNWLHFHKHNARGVWQHVISLVMTVVSGLAICAATMLELTLLLNSKGLETLPPWTQQATLFALIGQIGLNVLAFIGISLTDPDHIAKLTAMSPAPLPPARRTIVQQPTQHVEQVSYPQLSQGGAPADPLAQRSTQEWTSSPNGAKAQERIEQ